MNTKDFDTRSNENMVVNNINYRSKSIEYP